MALRPNLLVLMADQMTPGALPIYGHPATRAPVMERLAEHGVVFDAAYCNSPLCAPSRFSFMSGRLPSRIGAYDNAAEFGADIPTFAHYLRHMGYRTILCGKMHFCGPDQLHGFEERLTTDIYPSDFGWTPDWTRPEHRPSWYHNMSSVLDAGPCVRTNQLDFDDEAVFSATRRLFDIARGNDDRPFCLVVSLTHPHDPFAIPQPYWDLYDERDIDMPRIRLDPAEMDPHSRRLRHVCELDRTPVSDEQVLRARRAYYGAISYVDEQFGRVLAALDAAGLAHSTVTTLLSDHGEMLGERGLWYKMSFFEPSCRVPLVVSAPGLFPSGRIGAAVSLIDLLPTLLEIAGEGSSPELATPVEGRSLLAHLQRSGGHDEALGEYLGEGALAPVVMIRRGRHKFIHSPADPDQLYDLESDPDELVNLAVAEAGSSAAWRADVAARWDLAGLHDDILSSQRRRRLINEALSLGQLKPWDFQPVRDASREYVRNHLDLDDIEAMARFPRVDGSNRPDAGQAGERR
jgi:choline-sulfatase